MADAAQLLTGDDPQPAGATMPRFVDVEDADRRLSQVESGLRHFEAILPSMVREVERLRGSLHRPAGE